MADYRLHCFAQSGNAYKVALYLQLAGLQWEPVFVDFFNRPASTFKSIALLALQYNALIVVGGAFRLPEDLQKDCRWIRFNLTTQDIIDAADFQGSNGINELTQRFTSSLEALIRKAPEQYFWVHRRWKTPPDARRKRRAAAA